MKVDANGNLRIPKYLNRAEGYDEAKREELAAERWRPKKALADELNISPEAIKLTKPKPRAQGSPEIFTWMSGNVTKRGKDDETLIMLDKTIGNLGVLMEQMKEYAVLAEDPDLSDDMRFDLQIELTHLQTEFAKESHRLGLQRAGYDTKEIESIIKMAGFSEEEQRTIAMLNRLRLGESEDLSDDLSGTGEATDILDISDAGFSLAAQMDEIGKNFEKNLAEKRAALPLLDGELEALTDVERLERMNISLLSVDEAILARELLDEQIEDLSTMRTELKKFLTSERINSGAAEKADPGKQIEDAVGMANRPVQYYIDKNSDDTTEDAALDVEVFNAFSFDGWVLGAGEPEDETAQAEPEPERTSEDPLQPLQEMSLADFEVIEGPYIKLGIAESRLVNFDNPIDNFFQRADSKIKDDMYRKLGINAYIDTNKMYNDNDRPRHHATGEYAKKAAAKGRQR